MTKGALLPATGLHTYLKTNENGAHGAGQAVEVTHILRHSGPRHYMHEFSTNFSNLFSYQPVCGVAGSSSHQSSTGILVTSVAVRFVAVFFEGYRTLTADTLTEPASSTMMA